MNTQEPNNSHTHCWPLRLLRKFCPPHLLEEIEGDLLQRYERDVKRVGERKAKLKLWWNVIRFMRPGIVMRNKTSFNASPVMFQENFKVAFRQILRHKLFSTINVVGLATGIAACFLILQYALYEKSYDSFHPNKERIYRVAYDRYIDDEWQFSKAQTYPGVGPLALQYLPSVEAYTRMWPVSNHIEIPFTVDDRKGQKSFALDNVYSVDSSFVKIFKLKFIEGNEDALNQDNRIILSASMAKRFFGNEKALGKVIHWGDLGDRVVTGVFEDFPSNSHLKFSCLLSWMDVYGGNERLWEWDGFYTYFELKPGANTQHIERELQHLSAKEIQSTNARKLTASFHLQPLTSIHLESGLDGEMQINGNGKIVSALVVIAVLILLLAVINYFVLAFARFLNRTKEIGVRKIIGSSRSQLTGLLLTESVLVNSVAFGCGVALAIVLLPYVSALVNKEIPLTLPNNPIVSLAFSALLIIAISFIAVFYPARILANHNPAAAVKGMSLGGLKKSSLRRGLVLSQFLITQLLVAGTLLFYNQFNYILHKPLGFDVKQTMVVRTLGAAERDSIHLHQLNLFKAKVQSLAAVKNLTMTSTVPGRHNDWIGKMRSPNQGDAVRTRVDTNFIDTYGLRLLAGTNFMSENADEVLFNESAVKAFGYQSNEDVIGATVMNRYRVVGVVSDFHEESLRRAVVPSFYSVGVGYVKYVVINVNGGAVNDVAPAVVREWKQIFPDTPCEYFFLDDFFNQQYQQERQLSALLPAFSALAVFIACLGLFGFTYFMAQQRRKEMSIRKVLGASVAYLMKLMTSEFMIILIVAAVVSIPLVIWLGNLWLTQYAYRITVSATHILLPIALLLVSALITVSAQLVKTSNINPAEALRHE